MDATPVGPPSVVEGLSVRVVVGWMGLFTAAGCGVAGLLCWLYPTDLAQCEQGSSISAYDSVTSLPTRRLYLVLLGQALSRAEVTMRSVAVLVCVLEQFRPLSASSAAPNMTLVVRVQAARIKSALRPHDVVARLNEYTFAVVVDNLTSPDEARLIAKKIQNALALPLLIEGQELLVSCRIGGIMGPKQGTNAERLLGAAVRVLENDWSGDEGSTEIVLDFQSRSTRDETGFLSPIGGRHEAPLTSHR